MSRVDEVNVRPLNLPLRNPFEISLGTMHEAENLLVSVTTENGVTGWGEGAPLPPVTGETQASAVEVANQAGDHLVGRSLADYRETITIMREAFPGMVSALLAVETAAIDAYCRELDIPMAEFAGGTPTPVETDLTIPIVSPAVARERAEAAVEEGFTKLKIKTGNDVAEDIERVHAVREAAPDAALKVDANQGWTPKETVRFAQGMQDHGIRLDLIEQPVPASDVSGLAATSERVDIPVCADEALFDPADAIRLVRAEAADVFNVKLGKSGLLGALTIVGIAEAANIDLMIGQMIESSLATHTAAHLVAGTGAFLYVDLDGSLLMSEDIIDRDRSPVHRIDGPGHGIVPAGKSDD